MSPLTIQDLLATTAENHPSKGCMFYSLGETQSGWSLSYGELLSRALHNSRLLRQLGNFSPGSVILIHLEDQSDAITWFWSTVLAGAVPAVSTPLTNVLDQREQHVRHLHEMLQNPICITRESLLDQFTQPFVLNIKTIEDICRSKRLTSRVPDTTNATSADDMAMIMLTSGSTGNAKAVGLKHTQILAALSAKFLPHRVTANGQLSWLNWIGLDHVAALIEGHLLPMFAGAHQVHVEPSDILAKPLLFLSLISKHSITNTFAPNFFLARLRRTIETSGQAGRLFKGADLTSWRCLISGGEAVAVETCEALVEMLCVYGAPRNVIIPAFGMTETCAGSIYNVDFPSDNDKSQDSNASLGSVIHTMEMRVTRPGKEQALFDEPGDLQVRGENVFAGYYNNPTATIDAFTSDGWFKTGDRGVIDLAGNLTLVGRTKEVMTINGVKYLPQEVETILEGAAIPGVTPSYILCFPYRSSASDTESICIVYLPSFSLENAEATVKAHDTIIKLVMLHTGVRPYVLPLNKSLLPKSALGKLSRAKISASFLCGNYEKYKTAHEEVIEKYRAANVKQAADWKESLLLKEVSDILDLRQSKLGVETPFFDLGITSIELLSLKSRIEVRLSTPNLPLMTVMSNPTVRSLAKAIDELDSQKPYCPVVTLQPYGSKPPLWLVHPGVGEVLVFLELAKRFDDRPVYALRARGFEKGESYFDSIEDATSSYHKAMKAYQPKGPYAIAGYCYGAMLAYETARLLERSGDEVRFVGSFDLPPHIKWRMRQLDWTACLLHLAFFLGLIEEDHAVAITPEVRLLLSHEQAVQHVLEIADRARWCDLALTSTQLARWADLAYELHVIAVDYEPSGSVPSVDVFYAEPLRICANTKAEWVAGPLSRWDEFSRSEIGLHDCPGEHYTMIGPEHVGAFQKILKVVLKKRGL